MYYRGSFFFRALAAMLLLIFLVVGAALIFQAGSATGYTLGLSAGGSEAALPGAQPWGMSLSGPFMLLLALMCFGGLSFLVFFGLLGILGRKRWMVHATRRHPGDWDQAHAAHWGTPPWWRERKPEEQSQGSAEDPGSQIPQDDQQAPAEA
jgi:hypothetical protein